MIAFQSKANRPRTGHTDTLFCSCDLDLGSIALIYELDRYLDVLKMYLHTRK